MKEIKVSVIVPIFNVEQYLRKCLTSIVNQSLKEIEVILINDGSKDKSREIALEYENKYSNFKLIDKKNGGLSDARNFGMKNAIGEYVAFIDSDDYIDQSMLEKLYNRAKKYNADIACCDLMYIYDDFHNSVSVGADFDVSSYEENSRIIEINNSACNKLYRRLFIGNKSFPKGRWYEDLAVIPAWVAEANRVVYINEPLYYYIQRGDSIVHSIDERIFDVYWAIDNTKKMIETTTNEKCDVNSLYLNNGLVMTSLRIKHFNNREVKKRFIKKNIAYLNQYLPNWYQLACFSKSYTIKQKVIFSLMKMGCIDIVLMIYNRGVK